MLVHAGLSLPQHLPQRKRVASCLSGSLELWKTVQMSVGDAPVWCCGFQTPPVGALQVLLLSGFFPACLDLRRQVQILSSSNMATTECALLKATAILLLWSSGSMGRDHCNSAAWSPGSMASRPLFWVMLWCGAADVKVPLGCMERSFNGKQASLLSNASVMKQQMHLCPLAPCSLVPTCACGDREWE